MNSVIVTQNNQEIGAFELTRDGLVAAGKLVNKTMKLNTNPSHGIKVSVGGESVSVRDMQSISNDDEYTDEDISDMLRTIGKKLGV